MTDHAAPAAPAPGPAKPLPYWHPARRGFWGVLAIIVMSVAALVAVLSAWRFPPFQGASESTENAYVRGRVTVLAPQVSGYVTEVDVTDYQSVPSGKILVRIDDRIYRARVAQAQAGLDNAKAALANFVQAHSSREANLAGQTAALADSEAQLQRAQSDMARADDLVKDGSISKREHDQTTAALKAAQAQVQQSHSAQAVARQDLRAVEVGKAGLEAQVEAAQAQLRLAQIDLSNTVVRAPEGGRLSEVGVRLGQYVTNGTQLLSMVPADRWVIANFKEAQTRGVVPGRKAVIAVDALGGAHLTGHVESLAPAAGSEFAVIKPDNGTGNFVKVPQRIGVRILVDSGQPLASRLAPGMSVEATIEGLNR